MGVTPVPDPGATAAHSGLSMNMRARSGVINVPNTLPSTTSMDASSVEPPAFIVQLTLLAIVVGIQPVTTMPARTYVSSPAFLPAVANPNMMAGATRNENTLATACARQWGRPARRVAMSSDRPAMRKMSPTAPHATVYSARMEPPVVPTCGNK
jgi:hypothetical protein